jgi:two-component system, LuxR family, sensor kinase FixL
MAKKKPNLHETRAASNAMPEARLARLLQRTLVGEPDPAAVLIDRKWRILHATGDLSPYLTLEPVKVNCSLLDYTRRGLKSKLRLGVRQALSDQRPVTMSALARRGSATHPVKISVSVIRDEEQEQELALVRFIEGTRLSEEGAREKYGETLSGGIDTRQPDSDGPHATSLGPQVLLSQSASTWQLEEAATVGSCDPTVSTTQLEVEKGLAKATDREVTPFNPGLGRNDEPAVTTDSLQLLNEETSSLHEHSVFTTVEMKPPQADLHYLLAATEIAMLCLDTQLTIRWFTPAVKNVLRLRDLASGRPLADCMQVFADGALVDAATRVLENRVTIEDEAACNDGRVFLCRITPCITQNEHLDGVAITFVEITERKRYENEIAAARDMAEKIVDTVRESMLVLDPDLRVISANESFYRTFQVTPGETVGRLVYQLGNNQWDIPDLRQHLEEVLPTQLAFNNVEVEHTFESIGRKVMLLNARRIDHIQRILLAIQDITEHRLSEGRRAFLLELSDAFRGCEDPAELPRRMVVGLQQFLHSNCAVYAELEFDSGSLAITAQYSAISARSTTLPPLDDLGPELLASLLEPDHLAVADIRQDPRFSKKTLRKNLERLGFRSLLGVLRFVVPDRAVLVLVGYATPHPWQAEELTLVHELVERTWLAQGVARTAQALRDSEDRLRRAAEATGFGMYDYDVAAGYSIWSPKLYEITGVKENFRPDFQSMNQLVHPDDRRGFEACFQSALDPNGPQRHEMEYRIVRSDGLTCWIRDTGQTLVYEEEGTSRAIRVVGTIQDITERKRAELGLIDLNATLERRVAERTATLTMLREIATVSNRAGDVESAIRESLQQVCSYAGWSFGLAWLPSREDPDLLAPRYCWSEMERPEFKSTHLPAGLLSLRLRSGDGVAGQVFATRSAEFLQQPVSRSKIENADWSTSMGIQTVCACPLTCHGKTLGVLEFFADRPVEMAEQLRDALTNVGALLGHLLDRHNALENLHSEHELSEAILNVSRNIVVLLDTQGRILRINPHLAALTGYSLAEAQGRDWFDTFLPEQDRQQIRQVFERAVNGLPTQGNVNPIVTRDGELRIIEWNSAPLTSASGNLIGLVAVGHDITDLREALETAQRSEARLQAILTAAPDPIVSIDRRGVVIDANPATEKLFGYTADEVLGQNVSLLMPPPYREQHDGYINRYLETHEPRIIGIGREVKARRKDGRTFPIELAINEIAPFQSFVGIIRDITLRKQLEAEVVNATAIEQRRIGQDVHDGIGQQLTGLRYMAQTHAETLAAQSSSEVSTAQRMVDLLETVQGELRQIIRQLVPVEIDKHGLVAALQDLAYRTSEAHDLACMLECNPDTAISDAALVTHLYRIAQEAVQNVIKHARANQIRIRLEKDNEVLRLQVDDDGIGIGGGSHTTPGFGLRSMGYRASLIGADFKCLPGANGGTRVTCTVSLESEFG